MEPEDEWPEEAVGLRLLRTFLALPPEKRRRVLKFIEELACEADRCGEEGKASPT
jgi:hypothetical protein